MVRPVFAIADSLKETQCLSQLGIYDWLISYYNLRSGDKNRKDIRHRIKAYGWQSVEDNVFLLDSGAFSAWNSGAKINIWEYIEFIKEFGDLFTNIVCLDVIDDPVKSEVNHLLMRDELGDSITLIPVFHSGEPWAVLSYLCARYSYVGISPNNNWSEINKRWWLSSIFNYYDFEKSNIKTHGFGYTSPYGLQRYPLTTADSGSWRLHAAYGCIILREGVIAVSERRKHANNYFANIPGFHMPSYVDEWCVELGITFDDLVKNHSERTRFNALSTVRLFSDTSLKPYSHCFDLFSEERASSFGYCDFFSEDLVYQQYEKARRLGISYEG